MRALQAVAALLLLLPGMAQASLPVSFESPAQLGGHADAQSLDWALLVFHGGPATFRLEAGAASHVNHSVLFPVTDAPDGSRVSSDQALPERTVAYPDGLAADVAFTGAEWGSLYVEAESLRFAPAGINASLLLPGRMATPQELLPGVGQPREAVRPYRAGDPRLVPGDEPVLALRPTASAGAPFQLEATGLQTMEWHGAALSCPGPCPDGAGTQNRSVSQGGARVNLLTAHYGELEASSGGLRGSGTIAVAAAGSAGLDLGVKGWIRLPLTDIDSSCAPDCPSLDNQTLWAEGDLLLGGIRRHPVQGQRMEAELGGTVVSARVDEQAASLSGPVVSAAAIGAGLALGLALWRVLGAFFTRHSAGEALDNPVRRQVLDAVCQQPGCTYRDLMHRTGLSDGGVRSHLKVLERHGHIVSQILGGRRLYFENHGRYTKTWRSKAVLRDPVQQAILEKVSRNPGLTQADVVAYAFQAHQLSRTATRHRLRRLIEWGLLKEARDGRVRRYRPVVPTTS